MWLILIGIGVVLAVAKSAKAKPSQPLPPRSAWLVGLVRAAATTAGLDPRLVWGVVMTESSGDPTARNPLDPSSGLMGVTPLIARAYGGLTGSDLDVLSQMIEKPEANLRAGCGFLAHLQKRYGDKPLEIWVQAYNVGETKFDRGIRNTQYGYSVRHYFDQFPG